MSWLTKGANGPAPNYSGGTTALNDDLLNRIAGDIRNWGGPVDAAGNNLSNLGVLTFHANGYLSGAVRFGGDNIDGLARFGGAGAVSGNSWSWATMLGYNLKVVKVGSADALKTIQTHAAIGYCGIRCGGGIDFYCETGATTADATVTPTPKLSITTGGRLVHAAQTPYADNAAAVAAGLTAGTEYWTATGEKRIVV